MPNTKVNHFGFFLVKVEDLKATLALRDNAIVQLSDKLDSEVGAFFSFFLFRLFRHTNVAA